MSAQSLYGDRKARACVKTLVSGMSSRKQTIEGRTAYRRRLNLGASAPDPKSQPNQRKNGAELATAFMVGGGFFESASPRRWRVGVVMVSMESCYGDGS